MIVQDIERVSAGPCADCGVMVRQRIRCTDVVTRSRMELCEMCWHMFRQRQTWSGGCCG